MNLTDDISEIFSKILKENIQSIAPLGGMTNSNFLITTNKKNKETSNQYVLRMPGNNSNSMINRHWEKENQIITSNFGLNIPTVYFDENSGIKITKFLKDAETLKPNTIKNHIENISKELYKLHTSDVKFKNNFDPFIKLKEYLNLIKKENLYIFENDLKKALNIFNELKELLFDINQSKYGKNLFLRPTHGDLVAENILFDNGRIYIIDWEYSGLNDPMWDIASLFLENNFTKEDEKRFFDSYAIDKQDKQKIEIFKNIQDILWTYWTFAKLNDNNKEEYLKYAKMRLERALKYSI
ncbi:phosphotransferase [Campylobacter sp.]|uniref:phosphotransferase n=1 Tax=Campylobacter sp. TaxID=205 RepID=UPI003FA0A706